MSKFKVTILGVITKPIAEIIELEADKISYSGESIVFSSFAGELKLIVPQCCSIVERIEE